MSLIAGSMWRGRISSPSRRSPPSPIPDRVAYGVGELDLAPFGYTRGLTMFFAMCLAM